MVKKILCEYCDSTFAENLSSRNLHINSNAHKKNRRNYFSLHRDVVTLFLEERQKQSCRRFKNTGQCQFGLNCNFTHYSSEELIELINQEKKKRICKQAEKLNSIPTIDSWLIKYQQNLFTKPISSETNTKNLQLNYQYRNLPSLAPIADFDKLKSITLNTWSSFQG